MAEKATRISELITNPSAHVSRRELAASLDRVIDLVVERFVVLENRMAQVESKGLEYSGVWSRASTYRRGQITTHGGSLWICSADSTTATPGKSSDWTLAAKATK